MPWVIKNIDKEFTKEVNLLAAQVLWGTTVKEAIVSAGVKVPGANRAQSLSYNTIFQDLTITQVCKYLLLSLYMY